MIKSFSNLKKEYFQKCKFFSEKSETSSKKTLYQNIEAHCTRINEFNKELQQLALGLEKIEEIKASQKENTDVSKMPIFTTELKPNRRIFYQPGQKFAYFTLIKEGPIHISKTGRKYPTWDCLCDCGKTFRTTVKQIRKGIRKSCGCKRESNCFKTVTDHKSVILKTRYRQYEVKALRRKMEWKLTFDEFSNLVQSNCFYCTILPANKCYYSTNKKHIFILLNGVDRKDNTKGYTLNNVVPCCKTCNYAKNNLTYEEFKTWCVRLYKNMEKY